MKKKLMDLKYSLVVILSVLMLSTVVASCGDDEEELGDNIYYSAVLSAEYGGSADVLSQEIATIRNAFSKTLGANLEKGVNFHFKGTLERCDSKVRNACTEAKASLAGKTWQGYYVMTVTNENTDTKIFEYAFGTNKGE